MVCGYLYSIPGYMTYTFLFLCNNLVSRITSTNTPVFASFFSFTMCIDYQRVNKKDRILTPRSELFNFYLNIQSLEVVSRYREPQHWASIGWLCRVRWERVSVGCPAHTGHSTNAASIFDAGPTLKQHWVNVPCLPSERLVFAVWGSDNLPLSLQRTRSHSPWIWASVDHVLSCNHCKHRKTIMLLRRDNNIILFYCPSTNSILSLPEV